MPNFIIRVLLVKKGREEKGGKQDRKKDKIKREKREGEKERK